MKKIFTFFIIITAVSLETIYSQDYFKLSVKQPVPLIITLPEIINATAGEYVNLDTIFQVKGSSSWYRIWQFWNGLLLQHIYNPVFVIPGHGLFYLTVASYETGCSVTDTVALNIVTGIKDISAGNLIRQSIYIYPNPNSGTFDIKISGCRPGFYAEIINSLGVRLLEKVLDCSDHEYSGTITIPSVESGTFYFLVKDNNRVIYRQKVIILK